MPQYHARLLNVGLAHWARDWPHASRGVKRMWLQAYKVINPTRDGCPWSLTLYSVPCHQTTTKSSYLLWVRLRTLTDDYADELYQCESSYSALVALARTVRRRFYKQPWNATDSFPALRIALEQLGYNSRYHGFAAALENPKDCEMWYAALRAKFEGKGQLFGRDEFDQLLGHCQVCS